LIKRKERGKALVEKGPASHGESRSRFPSRSNQKGDFAVSLTRSSVYRGKDSVSGEIVCRLGGEKPSETQKGVGRKETPIHFAVPRRESRSRSAVGLFSGGKGLRTMILQMRKVPSSGGEGEIARLCLSGPRSANELRTRQKGSIHVGTRDERTFAGSKKRRGEKEQFGKVVI